MSYPPQPPPGQPYGDPQQEFYPQDPPPRKRTIWPYAVLVLAAVACGAAYVAYDRNLILKDSGVKACEAMAGGDKMFAGKAGDGKKLTEAEYRQVRAVFEDSRYDDIRDHGTKLMDLAWQISKMGDNPGLEALAYVGQVTEHMTGLQSACADQGIIVDLPAAAATPSGPPKPKCADVFTPGKKIAEDFGGECAKPDGEPWSILVMDCNDGRKLYQVDEVSGAEPGWGFSGGKYKADDTSQMNSKFFAASTDCTG